MVYIVPQAYICPKCKTEIDYSPHDGWLIPHIEHVPFCPTCYLEFVKKHIPLMERKNLTA